MTAQRVLIVLQNGLLVGLAVVDAALLGEALGFWTPGTLNPWPSLGEMIPFGVLFAALLVTLNLPRWWFVAASAVIAATTAGVLVYANEHDFFTPLYLAYFACVWSGLVYFRRLGLGWRHDTLARETPPQIGLRTILLLTSLAACSLAVAGMIRRALGDDVNLSERYGMRIVVPFNDEGMGIIWLQVLGFTNGVVLAVTSFAALFIVARRGAPLLRTLGAVLVSLAACGLFIYAWRLEKEWHYMLIESGFVAGFVGVNAAIVRAAGWTLEREPMIGAVRANGRQCGS